MIDWRQLLQKPSVIAAGAVTATGIAAIFLGGSAWRILLLILVGVALGCLVVWLIRRWREKRQAAQFRAGLNQNASKAPGGVHDPARRVELDRLRQKFNEGFKRVIEEGRRKGVDFLYRHPWIMVVGEPGSGKTEAIRHSGIVSPRMQDELQGVGGTMNMDWWFTERAVILDTAGRMVFEEEAGTASNEFQEFLRLLRKGRQLTPINGLLVTVSADTLVGGTDDQIRERSTKLGERIAQIQTALEVRFPVYVVVTKCDKITGFREFFESLDEPAMLNQILGWSNPEGLDVPFKAEQLEEHLSGVINTLRVVRFGLLDRLAGIGGGGGGGGKRRTDEVDSLYAFPHGLKTLAPRLKLYLDPVFAAGEWSSSAPLFVRGIYFSSALCQGAVLDQELAAALGVSVDELGEEGKVFRRDRALFLRDLFVEKMLPERGLVTASHRTEGIVLRRRIITWSTLAAVVVIGLGAFWWAHSTFRNEVERELELWKLARQNQQTDRGVASFAPLIEHNKVSGDWEFAGTKPLEKGSADVKRLAFHLELEASSQRELKRRLFSMGQDINELRRSAQRAVFVADLLQPLLLSVRDRISHDEKWDVQHPQILATLLQLETAIQTVGTPVPKGEDFAGPLLRFGVRRLESGADAKSLFGLFDRTYAVPVGGKRPDWPPATLSAGATLAENLAIRDGVKNLKRHWQQKAAEVDAATSALIGLRDALVELRNHEQKLAELRGLPSWTKEIATYGALRDKVDQRVEACVQLGVFSGNDTQLNSAVVRIQKEFDAGKDDLRRTIMTNPNARGKIAEAESFTKVSLLRDVDAELGTLSDGEIKRLRAAFPDTKRPEWVELDQQYLVADATGARPYRARVDWFKNLLAPESRGPAAGEPRLIGNLAKFDRMIVDRMGEPKSPPRDPATVRPGATTASTMPAAARELLIELYEGEFEKFLDDYARFPLVVGREGKPIEVQDLRVIRGRLAKIRDDVESLKLMAPSGRPFELRRRIERCLGHFDRILPALINEDDEVLRVNVAFPPRDEQRQAIELVGAGARYVGFPWRRIKGNGHEFNLNLEKEGTFGEFQVASGELELAFFAASADAPGGQAMDNPPVAPLANWGLFRQMLDPVLPSPGRSDDGRTWRRILFYRQQDDRSPEKFYFALSVRFVHPLPERANWPKWSQLKSP